MTHEKRRNIALVVAVAVLALAPGCSNSPYPGADEELGSVAYSSFPEPPKDLDPQRAYSTADGLYLYLVYEGLLEYDYLKRPVALQPGLALEVPVAEDLFDEEGQRIGIRYAFEIQQGVSFIDDPCFPDGKGRELKAEDFVFSLKRIADPKTNSPVVDAFSNIKGFPEYREKLRLLRAELKAKAVSEGADEDDVRISIPDLFRMAGDLEGVRATGDYTLEVVLPKPYPQILYWLSMQFAFAVPWEAVAYYDGSRGQVSEGEPMDFTMRPVGTGPYRFKWDEYNREAKIVLVRNEKWWGHMYPERKAPSTIFSESPGTPDDVESGIWTPERAGQPLAQIDRIEWHLEVESLSRFGKFLQGYYDASIVPVESFNQVIQRDDLTDSMRDRGVNLVKTFGLDVFYIGFNMDNDQIGAPTVFSDPELEANREVELDRRRKIRQAMALAIDGREFLRIFNNSLGVPAQSPLPPEVAGYDPDYRNPYQQYDPTLEKAHALLAEAGYKNGIDPVTGEPLKLSYDVGSNDTRSRTIYNFYIDAWKKLGINVELTATDYNQFQKKMYSGNYQIFSWGWLADYPDPENFLFLLYGPVSAKYGSHNPNHTRYENAEYDFLFEKMETMSNDETATWTERDEETGEEREVTMSRYEIIRALVAIFERDMPWIPMYHREEFALYHQWYHHVKPHPMTMGFMKYRAMDVAERERLRTEWNRPVRWPAVVIVLGVIAFLVPGAISVRRERR